MRVDQGGGEVISGGSVGRADGAEICGWRGWRGSGCLRPRMPEEPAEAEDGNRGSGDDYGKAATGHCAILVLYAICSVSRRRKCNTGVACLPRTQENIVL